MYTLSNFCYITEWHDTVAMNFHLCFVHKKEGTFLIACPAAHSLQSQKWTGFFSFYSSLATAHLQCRTMPLVSSVQIHEWIVQSHCLSRNLINSNIMLTSGYAEVVQNPDHSYISAGSSVFNEPQNSYNLL